jgi:hypothetical protein
MKNLHIVKDERYKNEKIYFGEVYDNSQERLYLLVDKENKRILCSELCPNIKWAFEILWDRNKDLQKKLKKVYGKDINIKLNIL